MSDKLSSAAVLETVRERFSDPLKWDMGGWGSGDRRCIVGTIREMSGPAVAGSTHMIHEIMMPKVTGLREPWFTAYEEVIFACRSIITPDWDAVAAYRALRGPEKVGAAREHEIILQMLGNSEEQLIHYNDSVCRSADEMVALMEEATKIVKEQRDARRSEFTGGKDESIVDRAVAAIPGLKKDDVVIASEEDGKAAEAEYEAMRENDPSLPPVWSLGWFGADTKKQRKKARDRVRARGAKSAERGIVYASTDSQMEEQKKRGYAVR